MKKTNKKIKSCKVSEKDYREIYGLGIIGTGIYYVSTATSFWTGILGILKALIWPTILTYEILKYIGA